MTSRIRVSEPRELLALIPYQLGFTPCASIVVVSLKGPTSRVGLVARVDLGDIAHSESGPVLGDALLGHLVSDGASGFIVVCYVDGVLDDDVQVPADVAAAASNLGGADAMGLTCSGVWIVDPERYFVVPYSPESVARGRVPVGDGTALTDLQSTAVGAQMVVNGAVVAPRREDLAPLPVVLKRHVVTAEGARTSWAREADPVQWRRDSLRLWAKEVSRARTADPAVPARNRPSTWGRIAAALEDVAVRDAVLLSFVIGEDRVPGEGAGWGVCDDELASGVAAILDPQVGVPPNPGFVEPSRDVLLQVLAHCSSARHAPSATLLALLAWWEGKGAEASVWLERALAVDPEYRLGLLMQEVISTGMPPGWVRVRANNPEAGEPQM